jgi:hypothetical protein
LTGSSSSRNTLPTSNNNDLSIGVWVKVSVSVKATSGNLYNMYYQSQSTTSANFASSALNKVNLGSTPFSNKIYLGIVTLPSKNPVFPGSFKEIAFFSEYHSPS